MNFETSRVAILTYLEANWAETPVIQDNSNQSVSANTIRPVIISGESNRVTIGDGGRHRRNSILIIQVFVEKNSGIGLITRRVDALADLFKDAEIGDAHFESPTAVRVGDTPNNLFQVNVQAPFYVDIC